MNLFTSFNLPSDFVMDDSTSRELQSKVVDLYNHVIRTAENAVKSRICLLHDGVLPPDAEIAAHGRRAIHPDGSVEYRWDDTLLARIEMSKLGEPFGWKIIT